MDISLAIIPPAQAREQIRNAMNQYTQYIGDGAMESTWHIHLARSGAYPSTTPLRQSFHPTVKILSIGQAPTNELWAIIQDTTGLTQLRASAIERTDAPDFSPFIPHIYLGTCTTIPPLGIIDTPLGVTFSVKELAIIQLQPYEILGTIPITP